MINIFQDVVPKYPTNCEVEWVDAEDPLFLLYTSGSTGKPKVPKILCSIDIGITFSLDCIPNLFLFFIVPILHFPFPLFLFFFLSFSQKGVLHTTGGYMVYTATTFKYAFDYKPSDIYWYWWNSHLLLFMFCQKFFISKQLNSILKSIESFSNIRCTADCGWITGHSYVTYGPMLNGATVVVFEGVSFLVLLNLGFKIDVMSQKKLGVFLLIIQLLFLVS